MKVTELQKRRIRYSGALILFGLLLVGFGHGSMLRAIAALLIVEDPLEPAAAIVALGGHSPFREMEAAKLYRAGWAPRVMVVRGAPGSEFKALQNMGIPIRETWELSREILIRQGVPAAAIVVPQDAAADTREELHVVSESLGMEYAPVILVTSKYHTRRTRVTWQHVSGGHSRAVVRPAGNDPFDPTRWWRERRFVLPVVREYLGLINYYAGFPVGTGR
ncbi:MAG: YdcF family protein [Deltaproteobacteria bacterium]|nr:YdcF family protein [Deltaproteobacteria bacterium]